MSLGQSIDDGAAGDPAACDPEAVLETVVALIADVIGDEYATGLDIGMDTTFQEDLELESIEFTALAERLMETYGDGVDFMGWLGAMDVDDIIAMTVGQLVRYISDSLTGGSAGGQAPSGRGT